MVVCVVVVVCVEVVDFVVVDVVVVVVFVLVVVTSAAVESNLRIPFSGRVTNTESVDASVNVVFVAVSV